MTYKNTCFKKVFGYPAVILLLIIFSSGCIVNDCRTLMSFKKVDDYPLYTMKYYGDYGFKDLQTGKGLNGIEKWGFEKFLMPNVNPQCACFSAMNPQSAPVFGRNFDWDTKAAMVLFTDPPNGYASVSMVDISYFGFGKKGGGLLSHMALLFAPQVPFDGMNECGLAVGIMAIPQSDGGNDPNKETIGLMQLLRQMLDHTANVDQALELAQKYNVVFNFGPTNHILVSDAAGNSAVIEYLNGCPSITRNTQPFQVSTNFILTGLNTEQALKACPRYRKAYQTLSQSEGRLDSDEAMAILNSISEPGWTVWSAVYGQSSGKIQLAMDRQYEQVYEFSLRMKDNEKTRTCTSPIPPVKATHPSPADASSIHPDAKATLHWTAGAGSKSHRIYLGEDENNLSLLAETKKPKMDLSDIQKEKKHYWRVDEVLGDKTIVAGDTWSFTPGSLVGLWRFDEAEGLVASDSSGSGRDAKLQGDAVFNPSAGCRDGAVYLDGSDDAVDIDGFSLTTNTITMTAWINGHRAKNWAGIISSRNGSMACGMYYGDDNRLHYTWNNNSRLTWEYNRGPMLPKDKWAFTACVIESDKATLYVYTEDDGLRVSVNKIKHIPQTLDQLKIGWDTAENTRRFAGFIDDVRIYNYALTKKDILSLCKNQNSKTK